MSAETLAGKVRQFRIGQLRGAAALLSEGRAVPHYLTDHPQVRVLPDYLGKLAAYLTETQNSILEELASLRSNIGYINEVVAMQQACARSSGVVDAIRIHNTAFPRRGVNPERDYKTVTAVLTDRHELLLILVILLGEGRCTRLCNTAS